MKKQLSCFTLSVVVLAIAGTFVVVRSDVPPAPDGPRLPTTLAFRKAQYEADQRLTEPQAPYRHTPHLDDAPVFKSNLQGGMAPLNAERLHWPTTKERLANVQLAEENRKQLDWMAGLLTYSFIGQTESGYQLLDYLIYFHEEKTGDDGVGTRYQFNGLTVQILDRRDLLMIVEPIKATRFGSLPKMELPEKERLKAIED